MHPKKCFAFAGMVLAIGSPGRARAEVVEYVVTGEVTNVGDFDFVVPALDPDLIRVPEVGDRMTARFKLDLDAPLSSFTLGIASYDSALSDVVFTLPDSGIEFSAGLAPVTTQNDALVFGQDVTDLWQTELTDGSGAVSLFTLPISDGGSPVPDATARTVSLRLEDIGSPNIFTTSPAPLGNPAATEWIPERTFEFGWDDLFGLSPFVQGVVTGVTPVPEPPSLIIIALASMHALVRRNRVRKASMDWIAGFRSDNAEA